ncbi:prolyl oligopeptidase family serine peptidase [Aquimarina amphilecti]|nr:prolyl oligopeptidase family serine peptidase [Aquimarina amphilecti]
MKLFFLTLLFGCQESPKKLVSKEFREDVFGIVISDPFRYAENLEDSLVKDWINDQRESYLEVLNKIDKLDYIIDEQVNYDQQKSSVISKLRISENGRYFYLKRLPKENIPKLYYRKSFLGKEQLLYDPKSFRLGSNTEFVINYIKPSIDGSKIVVSLTSKGKEISELIIIDVTSGEVSQEILTNAWPSAAGGIQWLQDNTSFIYVYHPVTNQKSEKFLKNTRSVLYTLGDKANKLKVVLSKENNPDLIIKEEDFPAISIIGEYLIGKITGGGGYYDAYYLNIKDLKTKKWKPLFTKLDYVKSYRVAGDSILFRTAKDAPNFKICKTSIINPDFNNAQVLVKDYDDQVITDFELTSEGIYYVTNKNGVKASLYRQKDDLFEEVKLPQQNGNLSISSLGQSYPELWINARGWVTNNKRYLYASGKLIDQNLQDEINSSKLENIVVEEIEVEAADGAKIPLSLIYNKNLVKDGKNRVLMDGYGSFGISMKPGFSLRRLLWVMEGGVYAIAHVRGGGEKGDAWHKAAYKATKPNTWKDFINCAEFLVEQKYTNPTQLAIWSGSAGGIMVGRAITERPDLFGVAIVEFGSLNVSRSSEDPNGANIAKEFGSPDNPEEFKHLLEMDAYQHIKNKENYPATLLTAGLNDPRVPAWNSIKFAARIQEANISGRPNYLLIDSDTGHAIDDTKLVEVTRFANILSFALWQTGHPEYQPE